MNALAQRQDAQVIQTDGASLMEVISRAAQDPNTDVDKLERLMGLYERITSRQAEQAFAEAMNKAQADMAPIATDKANKQTSSRYASYTALDRAVRPIYTAHGFAPTFGTGDGAPPEHVRVLCKLSHRDGHSETYHVDMPADGKGAKGGDVMTKTHAAGSAFSYGQRYLLKLIFNLAVGDDDDGNAAGGKPDKFVTADQIGEMQELIDSTGADKAKFLSWLGVERLAEIPAARFASAVAALNKKAGS
jgi:hypothetical protein